MEHKENQKLKQEGVNPVSRKTNEEIDEDENGNLLIEGQPAQHPTSSNPKTSLNDQNEHLED